MRSLLLGLMLLFYFSSCSSSKVRDQNQKSGEDFTVLYISEYGGSGEESTLIFTEKEKFADFWNATINQFDHAEDVPEVDFEKEMVVVRQFESRNMGGDEYKVESVDYNGNKVLVNYTITSPGAIGTTAITNPMIILTLKKTPSPEVEFILIRI